MPPHATLPNGLSPEQQVQLDYYSDSLFGGGHASSPSVVAQRDYVTAPSPAFDTIGSSATATGVIMGGQEQDEEDGNESEKGETTTNTTSSQNRRHRSSSRRRRKQRRSSSRHLSKSPRTTAAAENEQNANHCTSAATSNVVWKVLDILFLDLCCTDERRGGDCNSRASRRRARSGRQRHRSKSRASCSSRQQQHNRSSSRQHRSPSSSHSRNHKPQQKEPQKPQQELAPESSTSNNATATTADPMIVYPIAKYPGRLNCTALVEQRRNSVREQSNFRPVQQAVV